MPYFDSPHHYMLQVEGEEPSNSIKFSVIGSPILGFTEADLVKYYVETCVIDSDSHGCPLDSHDILGKHGPPTLLGTDRGHLALSMNHGKPEWCDPALLHKYWKEGDLKFRAYMINDRAINLFEGYDRQGGVRVAEDNLTFLFDLVEDKENLERSLPGRYLKQHMMAKKLCLYVQTHSDKIDVWKIACSRPYNEPEPTIEDILQRVDDMTGEEFTQAREEFERFRKPALEEDADISHLRPMDSDDAIDDKTIKKVVDIFAEAETDKIIDVYQLINEME